MSCDFFLRDFLANRVALNPDGLVKETVMTVLQSLETVVEVGRLQAIEAVVEGLEPGQTVVLQLVKNGKPPIYDVAAEIVPENGRLIFTVMTLGTLGITPSTSRLRVVTMVAGHREGERLIPRQEQVLLSRALSNSLIDSLAAKLSSWLTKRSSSKA